MKFEHINLVRSLAWSFHRSTGINWKELFSEACLAYCEVIKLHNPKKGAQTTWLYRCIQSRLINFCKQEQKYKTPQGVEDWYTTSFEVFEELFYSDAPLSENTKEIIEMVLQDPLRYALPPRKAIGKIRTDLREQKKWPWPRVWESMKNLRIELIQERSQRTIWL